MKICKICGSQLEDYAAFCTNCGTTVEAPEQPQYQQPVNSYDYYSQPETAEENIENYSEPNAFETASLFVKKIKTAFITSIISTAMSPFYLIMWFVFVILALIPIVNIVSGIIWLFLGTAIIVTALVCGIIALVNTSKTSKLPPVYEGSIDEELFKTYLSAQKKAKVAKILGIISVILWALFIVLCLAYYVFLILMLVGVLGAGFLSEMSYYF